MPATAKVMQRVEPTSAKTIRLAPRFADLIQTRLLRFDSYRPELHYMRGPGPKWHAKNDPAPASLDHALGGSRTPLNISGALASFLRFPEWTVPLRALFTGLALLHHTPNHRFAEAKRRIWR